MPEPPPPSAAPPAPPAGAGPAGGSVDETVAVGRRGLRARDLALPIGLSLAALVGIGVFAWDREAFVAAAHAIRPATLLLALGALAVQITAGGLRLRHVSRGLLTRAQGIRGQMTWDFMSAVTPSAVGGGPFAAYFMARGYRVPIGEVTAMMLFVMLMDQVWFATLIVGMYVAAVWLPVFPTSLGAVGIGTVGVYLGGLLLYIAFFTYATFLRPDLIERVARAVVRLKWLRRFQGTVRSEARKMKDHARRLRGQPASFYLQTLALTVVVWVARYSVLLFVALSFTRDLRPVLFLLRTAGLWLAGMVMPTPGGSGGIEALFLLYLAPLLPEGLGAPVLIVWRLVGYYLVLVLGVFAAGGVIGAMLRGKTVDEALDSHHAP